MQWNLPTLALLTVIGWLAANESSAQVVRQEVAGVTNFAKIESTVACAGAITPAAIQEINTVRKHLSQIQGGRLAAACKAPVVALMRPSRSRRT